MKHESELITAVNEGFRRWLTVQEVKSYIEAERERSTKAPELFMVAFNPRQGYFKVEATVVKMTSLVDEAGKLLDLELLIANEVITEPVKIMVSAFQEDSHPRIQHCRIFTTVKDRDLYYDDIRFMAELNDDYQKSMIEYMRRQMGF